MATSPVRLGAPKDSMEPRKTLPAGRYVVRCDGFKPKISKNKDNPSVNFNPIIKVTNHQALNGEKVYTALNQNAGFILEAFCHMLGHAMIDDGQQVSLPGEWFPDANAPQDVSKMRYQGPLLGATGELELVVGPRGDGKPGQQNFIKTFYCKVPGCTKEHPSELT